MEWSIREEGTGGLRIVVPGGTLPPGIQPVVVRKGIVRAVQPVQRPGGVEVTVVSGERYGKIRAFSLKDPDRIVVDVLVAQPESANTGMPPSTKAVTPPAVLPPPPGPMAPAVEALPAGQPNENSGGSARASNGKTEAPPIQISEALRPSPVGPNREGSGNGSTGLTIVLDPGHGGHDTGAVGPTGLMEKDVVLDLALRLRSLLRKRLGVRVLMTRSEDVFVPLQERTAIANRAKADFFISLHVNGSRQRGAVGFETYYFTREPSDNDARASAQRENLVIERDGTSGKDQESLLRITLADMAVTRDIKESGELAELALSTLDKILKVENRGVKSGPFYVLATAAMPAVLVESAFITNPREERKLQQDQYRQRIAEALFEGIEKYKVRYERRVGMRDGASAAAGS